MRIIKRYANRKLYDTQHSRYVTLDQISDMIREGDEVQIIDNKTKEDLTSVTLAQIIFEEEKKQKSFLPLQTMRNIIATGGESISQLMSQAQRRVSGALHPSKREDGIDGGAVPVDEGKRPVDDVKKPASLPEFREWVANTQRTIDVWQKRVDDRIRNVVEGISPFAGVQKDIRDLASRIAELEGKLSNLVEHEGEHRGEHFGGEAAKTGADPAPEVRPDNRSDAPLTDAVPDALSDAATEDDSPGPNGGAQRN